MVVSRQIFSRNTPLSRTAPLVQQQRVGCRRCSLRTVICLIAALESGVLCAPGQMSSGGKTVSVTFALGERIDCSWTTTSVSEVLPKHRFWSTAVGWINLNWPAIYVVEVSTSDFAERDMVVVVLQAAKAVQGVILDIVVCRGLASRLSSNPLAGVLWLYERV